MQFTAGSQEFLEWLMFGRSRGACPWLSRVRRQISRGQGQGMKHSQGRLADGERPRDQGPRLVQVALLLPQEGQAMQRLGGAGMLLARLLSADGEDALV